MTDLCAHTHHERRPTEGVVMGWTHDAPVKQRCVVTEAEPGQVTAWPPGLQGAS
jgi:hypothetical protein